MEITNLNNTASLSGTKPATDSIPVLTAPASGTQPLTANAVKTVTPTEKTTTGKQATGPEKTSSFADMAQIKETLQSLSRASGLEFAVDDELGRVIVKVVDPETQEILKQFPSEEALNLAHTLHGANGGFLRAKA